MSRLTLFLVDYSASDCWLDLPPVLFWHNDLAVGHYTDSTRPGWADSVDPNVYDLAYDGWQPAPFAGPVVDGERVPGKRHDAAVLFAQILASCVQFHETGCSWTDAARLASVRHGLPVRAEALEIVADCVRFYPATRIGNVDADYWAAEFFAALTVGGAA